MRVNFTITRRDLFFGHIHMAVRSRANHVLYALMIVVIGAMEWSTLPQPTGLIEFLATIAALKVVLLIVTVAFILLTLVSFSINCIHKREPGVLCEHTIELTDDGLIETTEVNRSEAKWSGIFNVVRTRNYLLIYVGRTNAHLVPRHSFDSDLEYDKFFTFCCVKREEAESAPPKLAAA